MDEPTSRASTPGRRMASAKPASTTRRSSGSRAGRKGGEPEISRARWAGVALVVASLVGAIALAVISPSDPETPGQAGAAEVGSAPIPAIDTTDTRVPTEQPTITSPKDGWTVAEWDIDVTVDVPKEALARRLLTLVILRDGDETKSLPKPQLGGKATVGGVRLVEGQNVLTAALRGPGGLGPESDPVTIEMDRDAPVLTVTSPAEKAETIEPRIGVTGSSEAGATVEIENSTTGWDSKVVVGPSGSFEFSIPLRKGKNRIVVRSTDEAGMTQRDSVVVQREDGQPMIEIDAPQRIKRSTLPRSIRVVVDVSDADGRKIEGAAVSYSLGGPGRTSETFSDETRANGRSVWTVEVAAASSTSPVQLTVEVIAPNGFSNRAHQQIIVS